MTGAVKFISLRRGLAAALVSPVFFIPAAEAQMSQKMISQGGANSFTMPNPSSFEEKSYFKFSDQKVHANADSLDFVGGNIIANGNVEVTYQDIVIRADKAIVNAQNKDIDAKGNIRLKRVRSSVVELTLDEFDKQRQMADRLVEIVGYRTTTTGEQRLMCKVSMRPDIFRADRISGNLQTGALEFDKFIAGYRNFFCTGKSASRSPEGTITVTDAYVTTCEYIEDDQEHYSIGCGTLVIKPRSNPDDMALYNPDLGEHSYWGYNCTMNLGGIPVAWLPVVYKPADESPGLFQVSGGYDSDMGVVVKTTKKFTLMDDPAVTDRVYLDYYSKHGIGAGNELWIDTANSKTNLFTYFIHDQNKWGTDDKDDANYRKEKYRLSVPSQRYDIKASNLTHITPRLDFRGNLEVLSDINFLDDYFSTRGDNNPQPSTYATLEYQHEYFSAGALIRPRVNDFYTTLQAMPEFSLSTPRQELFGNLYHQSSTSFDNFRMTFRNWDEPRTTGNKVEPESYGAIRFDSLHMFYYPLTLFDWLNLTPRAGGRVTYYNTSSKRGLDEKELSNLFIADDPDRPNSNVNVVNYDSRGGSVFRFTSEFGMQADTKISQAWQGVKNVYWDLDGLRHVAQPYLNYTYIPKPTEDRDHIYYFDDTDRIDEQNFLRFGIKNRLQTRRGDFGREAIYEWASMENYVDYHFNNQGDFSHLGNIATILRFNPTSKLSLSSTLLLDLTSDKELVDTHRNGRTTSRAGISSKWINKWDATIRYKIIDDLSVYISYVYQDAYRKRSIYSMGSTLAAIDPGTAFERSYDRSQSIRIGFDTPVPYFRKMKFGYEFLYDVEAALMREQSVRLSKAFHCWELALVAAQEVSRGSDGNKEVSHSIMATLSLTAMPGVRIGQSTDSYASGNN